MKKNMMGFHDIVGQDGAIRILKRMLEKGRVPHAMLFTGIDGSGRQTTAKALAMAMNCRKPTGEGACTSCSACRKMLSGNHPDLVFVQPAGAAIKIDQIRALRRQLRYAPNDGGYRIIIVNDAQTLNLQASNAMLKTLEEPPNNTHIILTAPETSDLLETIVSRCQQVTFRPIPMNTIVVLLQKLNDMDGDTARCIALLSKGSLGMALSAKAEKWMSWRTNLMEQLVPISQASIPSLFAFAENLSRDKDGLQEALDMVSIWLRDLLIWKFCPDNILNKDYTAHIAQASPQLSEDDLLQKMAAVFSAQQKISRNANRRLALEVMMMALGGQGALQGMSQ